MKRKRRVLEELKLTEISGVDFPCQEDARVAIMKRKEQEAMDIDQMEKVAELEGAVCDLEAKVSDLTKRLERASEQPAKKLDPFKRVGVTDFQQTVSEIKKRDNCTRTEAFSKARKENPDAFAAYQEMH
jgi:hypothetical protein